MEKRTVLDRIEMHSDGTIRVRLLKQIADCSGEVVFSEPHRLLLTPLSDPGEQKRALDEHLGRMGFPALGSPDWQSVLDETAAWTPDVVAAWEARRDAS